jgi:invasion protein IalB
MNAHFGQRINVGLTFLAVLILSLSAFAAENPAQNAAPAKPHAGVPTDWSMHHLSDDRRQRLECA